MAELDRIFKRIYEDHISGTISHEQDMIDFDSFAALVRKYVGIRELTPTIVNEFVRKIIIHAPDKSSGRRVQRIQLVWNSIGELEVTNENKPI